MTASIPDTLRTLSDDALRRLRLKIRARMLTEQNGRAATPDDTRITFHQLSDAVSHELARRTGDK